MAKTTTEETRHLDEELFTEAIGKSAKTEQVGYLGDPTIVKFLLQNIATEFFEKINEPNPDVPKLIEDLSAPAALALLGADPNYSTVRGWNKPGAIDAFVAKWCGVDETSPRIRITGGIAAFLRDLIGVANYAGVPGVLNEQWQPQVNGIFEWYVGIFMGVSPPAMAML